MGPVHEELGPPFVHSLMSLGYSVSVWLHPGSFAQKGDVFAACNYHSSNDQNVANCKVYYEKLFQPSAQDFLLQQLKKNNCCLAIFLTLQNEWSTDLAKKVQDSGISTTGIVHNIDKLSHSKVIDFWANSCFHKPIVLARHVESALMKKYHIQSQIIHSVYKPSSTITGNLNAINDRCFQYQSCHQFSMLGGINFSSRKYKEFIGELVKLQKSILSCISFVAAGGGKDRSKFISLINEAGVQDLFEFALLNENSGRVNYDLYYRAIAESDAVLVLPGPGYTETKITSALPSAISFCKPIITTVSIAEAYGLNHNNMAYAGQSINDAILHFLQSTLLDHSQLKERIFIQRDKLLRENNNMLQQLLSSL